MLSDPFFRYFFNIDTLHRFGFFLGTTAGELLKRFIELVFYLIIVYMIISEYKKNRKREYKYLIVGFFALFLTQFFMSLILFSKVFGIYKFTRFGIVISFMDGYLETVALLLLATAFVFPAFKEQTRLFQRRIVYAAYIITIVTLGTYVFFKVGFIGEKYALVIPDIMQMAVLLSPFYLLKEGDYKKIKYRKSILIAFFIYFLIPFINATSLLIAGTIDQRLLVLQHPLPFLSILLLMRGVYLTLVDKAFLTSKLKISEEIIEREKELNMLKDHFISVVSHELRTPVTSMKLYLSLLAKGKFGNINEKQEKAVKTLIDENDRLGDLINDLLTINKIESGKLQLSKEEFFLDEITDELYINIAKNNGLKVINRIKKGFKVIGDKTRLKQVYINLINNAIKFSEKGGKIELNCGIKGKKWFFSVKDAGVGISKEELPKLFNKFYQGDNPLVRKHQGIGLGLSIVKNIIELHGGNVEVHSQVGKGSEFRVWIPIE